MGKGSASRSFQSICRWTSETPKKENIRASVLIDWAQVAFLVSCCTLQINTNSSEKNHRLSEKSKIFLGLIIILTFIFKKIHSDIVRKGYEYSSPIIIRIRFTTIKMIIFVGDKISQTTHLPITELMNLSFQSVQCYH